MRLKSSPKLRLLQRHERDREHTHTQAEWDRREMVHHCSRDACALLNRNRRYSSSSSYNKSRQKKLKLLHPQLNRSSRLYCPQCRLSVFQEA